MLKKEDKETNQAYDDIFTNKIIIDDSVVELQDEEDVGTLDSLNL